jgi:hypothetical protein
MFEQCIKHDPSVYPTLRNELWNDNLHHSFAGAQDVSDVLNATYLPVTSTEIDLFQEKQKYLYAILELTVEAAKG